MQVAAPVTELVPMYCVGQISDLKKGLSDMRYPVCLASLGLETLQARRLKYDLQMCYKVIHNQISVLDDFLVFPDCTSTRGHCYRLYKGYSQVNTHKYFFTTVFVIYGMHYRAQQLKHSA